MPGSVLGSGEEADTGGHRPQESHLLSAMGNKCDSELAMGGPGVIRPVRQECVC